jgi:hypothetical protein
MAMWFQSRKPPEVQAGQVFSTTRGHRIIEVVEVLEPRVDISGLPHVRFRLSHLRPGAKAAVPLGVRTLAHAAFAETYPPERRMSAAQAASG